jgi:hypothetical protein
MFLALVIAGCGGGGGSSDGTSAKNSTGGTGTGSTGTNTGSTGTGSTGTGSAGGTTTSGTPAPVSSGTVMAMSCAPGVTQCSGNVAIRTENGVTLTSSGVQAYGKSTSDLVTPIADTTTATGFVPASGGLAEVRIVKDAAGTISNPSLLLSNLGISWNGTTERPQIVETFNPTLGRTILNADGTITSVALPASTDLTFWDFATKGAAGTQANYANNRYFPRTDPIRCPAGVTCSTQEAQPLTNQAGDWRQGGTIPDVATVSRLHSDGDVHGGNGKPDANGNPTYLTGATAAGVPFPGSKGYRSFVDYSYQYANLGAWISSDTAMIGEWANQGQEHTQNRRGMVSFGQVTDAASVPSTGTASYKGIVYGWYSATQSGDPEVFRADATMTVDFATRKVTITTANAVTYTANGVAVPLNFTTTVTMGAAGTNVANYMTGTAAAGTLTGGISGRYYGPVAGSGPTEIGGAFTLSNNGGSTAIGGFLGRKI